ncbi:hypothetical protein OG21DRAFT_1515465 [Imleria badia]|nr:hypothetical protein OG21DRAFT_1515465 [Imleria badia]
MYSFYLAWVLPPGSTCMLLWSLNSTCASSGDAFDALGTSSSALCLPPCPSCPHVGPSWLVLASSVTTALCQGPSLYVDAQSMHSAVSGCHNASSRCRFAGKWWWTVLECL